MASRDVIWTKTAQKQRREILKYWFKRTGTTDYSIKIIKLSAKRTAYLSEYPELGQLSEFPNTRVTTIGHYSIFYKITEKAIVITAFWDNRQDPKKLLKLLSKK